jgi:hypothetical protein
MSSALGALEEFDKYSYQHGNTDKGRNCTLCDGGSGSVEQVEWSNFWTFNLANSRLLAWRR